jgi:hypothetical protein
MITSAAECRKHAEKCEAKARTEDNVGIRTTLFGMARDWTSLADRKERLRALRRERGRPRS